MNTLIYTTLSTPNLDEYHCEVECDLQHFHHSPPKDYSGRWFYDSDLDFLGYTELEFDIVSIVDTETEEELDENMFDNAHEQVYDVLEAKLISDNY